MLMNDKKIMLMNDMKINACLKESTDSVDFYLLCAARLTLFSAELRVILSFSDLLTGVFVSSIPFMLQI